VLKVLIKYHIYNTQECLYIRLPGMSWCSTKDMRLEVFMAVNMWIMVFLVERPCSLVRGYQHFGGRYNSISRVQYVSEMFLWNVGNHLQGYMLSQPIRLLSTKKKEIILYQTKNSKIFKIICVKIRAIYTTHLFLLFMTNCFPCFKFKNYFCTRAKLTIFILSLCILQ
jgi:hypothetical protein